MTAKTSSTPNRDADRQNPFPATAVSKLSGMEQDYVSIQTDATQEAAAVTKSYLAAATAENGGEAGQVVAVVGEYGTGKTHIALQILNDIRADENSRTEAFYLDAPADTFLALYRERFFSQLARTEVIERVREYFSDIIAEDLERSELTRGAAQILRERKASPLETIEKFGLMDSPYRDVLTKQLEKVTERSDFATAFSLMLRPEFEYAVWEWFAGQEPDQSLVDRGISRALNTDTSALEAIGVFAFLFGRQNWRFVLIIDEMEKVLTPSSSSKSQDTILAFKKMMEAVGKTNSMLILVGLPDFLDALPDDARQRLSSTIRPSNLTAKNVENYVTESKKRYGLGRGLKPFNRDAITYISEIAGGNARKVVRLCFHAYRQASEADTNVTQAMIRAIAREQFEVSTVDDVSKEILRIIDANGWLHETEKSLERGENKQVVDVWLPVGESINGCAIFIENSILDASTSEALIGRAKSFSGASSDSQILTLLIVNGHVAENLRKALEQAFDRVLVNSIRSFAEDLDAILKGMVRRIEERSDKEAIAKVLARVEQISRQLSSLRHEISERLENLEVVSLASRTEITVENAILGAFRSIGEREHSFPLSNLRAERAFEKVQRLIAQATYYLNNYKDFPQFERRSSEAALSLKLSRSIEKVKRLVSEFKGEIQGYERQRIDRNRMYEQNILERICKRYDSNIRGIYEDHIFLRELRMYGNEMNTPPEFYRVSKELPELLLELGRTVFLEYGKAP